MNRVTILGMGVFLALVAISLFGGADTVMAGHGCCGCHGASSCDCGGYEAPSCCGEPAPPTCCGYETGAIAPPLDAPPAVAPPAPMASNRRYMRQPVSFRRISFRR